MKLNLDTIRDRNGFYLTPSQLKEDLIEIIDVVRNDSSEVNQLTTRLNIINTELITIHQNIVAINNATKEEILQEINKKFFEVSIQMSNLETTLNTSLIEVNFLKSLWFVKLSLWFINTYQKIKNKLK